MATLTAHDQGGIFTFLHPNSFNLGAATLTGDGDSFTVIRDSSNENGQVTPGGLVQIFTGNFTYNQGELAGGTITGVTETVAGMPVWEFSGIGISVATYLANRDNDNWNLFHEGLVESAIAPLGDLIHGGNASHYQNYYQGEDDINGYDGNDTIFGDSGSDALYGSDGNDFLQGNADRDYLDGGADNDTLLGGKGDDFLSGGLGNDSVQGNLGNDHVVGDEGNDILHGGKGDDTLEGNLGNDTLFGDMGADRFDFTAFTDVAGSLVPAIGNDIIMDFMPGTDSITLAPVLYAIGRDGAGEAVIVFSTGGTITLLGVSPEQLHPGDIHL